MNLMQANTQWSTRPNDQRFWNLTDMLATMDSTMRESVESDIRLRDLNIVSLPGGELGIAGATGTTALFNNWSFGQLCSLVKAPASYLRGRPTDLVKADLMHDISNISLDTTGKLLLKQNGDLRLRAITSERYTRDGLWNALVVQRLKQLEDSGWRVPPARPVAEGSDPRERRATKEDVIDVSVGGGMGINVGDMIAPAGLYASDKDMFAFLVNPSRILDIGGAPLCPGFFCWNSEVGAMSFGLMTFLLNGVCGNHIVWGARDISEVRVVHVGKAADKAWNGLTMELKKYADSELSEKEMQIKSAIRFQIAGNKADVIQILFDKGVESKSNLIAAFDLAEQNPRDASGATPTSAWGMVQGMTRLSQQKKFTDDRVDLDRAAFKVLKMAF